MFYYLYEIRNNLNGKIYVGVHKTRDMNDGYMGSGKVIRSAIAKHGIENFTKVVLETFENAEAMYAKEKEVVTDEFLLREDTYNLRRGGLGGWDYVTKHKINLLSERFREYVDSGRAAQSLIRAQKFITFEKRSETSKKIFLKKDKKQREAQLQMFAEQAKLPEAIERRKNRFKEIGHQQGEKHSQFGTCWIYHELIGSKKCRKELLPEYIEQGWFKGRNKFK